MSRLRACLAAAGRGAHGGESRAGRRNAATRSTELGPLDPRPMARPGLDVQLGAEGRRVVAREAHRQVPVPLAPHDERRDVAQAREVAAGLRAAARATPSGRAAGSPAACPGRSLARPARRASPGSARRSSAPVVRADRDLAERRGVRHTRAPAVPAVARQQRDGVDDDEALDALRVRRRPRQPGAAPVVDDEADAVEAERVDERAGEAGVAVEREVAVAALGRAAEAGQVGRDAAGALEERQPVVGARRHAVQLQRSARRRRRAPDEHRPRLVGQPADRLGALVGHGAA